MKEALSTALWAALTATLCVLAAMWPPVGYVLIAVGALCVAFMVLLFGEGIAREMRLNRVMRRYERSMAQQEEEYLAHRARVERQDSE
ncbi:hypothetical protein AB0I81_30115 [Nonomuraea sp. NPDC050404]|uniref:hypothetical protein n=1 Tax=Nonomuraea sp. NPDC050404 TaxID=3155783 RepID=UPI0033D6078D